MSTVNTLGGGGVVSGVMRLVSQQTKIVVTAADVSSNTQDKFFFISTTATDYTIRNSVSGGGSALNLPGRTDLTVTYATNSSIATIATAIASALNGSGQFTARAYNDTVYVYPNTSGLAIGTADAMISGHTITTPNYGQNSTANTIITIPLFTTPNTPDYGYKIVMTVTTKGSGSGMTFSNPSSTAVPLLVGPNTQVNITGFTTGSSDIYSITYTYLAYKLT